MRRSEMLVGQQIPEGHTDSPRELAGSGQPDVGFPEFDHRQLGLRETRQMRDVGLRSRLRQAMPPQIRAEHLSGAALGLLLPGRPFWRLWHSALASWCLDTVIGISNPLIWLAR